MASVRKKGPTFYACFVDHTGKRAQKATKARTRTEAKALAGELERQAERQRKGLEVHNTEQTWGELADLWLQQHASGQRSYETTKGRLELHLRPALGALKLLQVTPLVLDKLWKAKLKPAGPLAAQTVVHLRNIVSSTFRDAKRWRLWSGENPATVSEAPKVIRQPVAFAQVEEVAAILRAATGEFRMLVACAVSTGLREGELLALRRENVDLERGMFKVIRTTGSETTKGRKWRPVPMLPALKMALQDYLSDIEGDVLFPEFNSYKGGGVRTVISRELDKALVAAKLVQHWEHICRRKHCRKVEKHPDGEQRKCAACGYQLWPRPIPKALTFHGLRHTFITHLLEGGADPFAVQRIAGHATLEVTLGTYAHAGTAYLTKQAEKLPSFGLCGPGVDSGEVVLLTVPRDGALSGEDDSVSTYVPGGIRTLVTGLKGPLSVTHPHAPTNTALANSSGSESAKLPRRTPTHTGAHAAVDSVLTTNAAPLLTVAGVARWLSVSTATVYALVKAGDIPHQRLPRGGIRFDGDQVERWLVAREVGGKST